VAVDASAAGLRKAQQLAARHDVVLVTEVADLAEFQMGEAAWDAIVCTFGHFPPTLRQQVHHAIVRALKPGGVFLGEFYTPAQLAKGTGGPSDPALLVTAADMAQGLAGLEMELLQEVERDLLEGSAHVGSSATVQVVACCPIQPYIPGRP